MKLLMFLSTNKNFCMWYTVSLISWMRKILKIVSSQVIADSILTLSCAPVSFVHSNIRTLSCSLVPLVGKLHCLQRFCSSAFHKRSKHVLVLSSILPSTLASLSSYRTFSRSFPMKIMKFHKELAFINSKYCNYEDLIFYRVQ